jgi:hypothetical protein
VIGATLRAWLVFGGASAAIAMTVAGSRADDAAAAAAHRDAIVARVGSGRVITAGELEDAMGRMPSFQRVAYGAAPDEIRRRVLSEVLVPEALLTAAAEERGLAQRPSTARAFDWARSAATIRALRSRALATSSVTDDDVRSYYDAHVARFESPERYRLSRILCATREEAQRVLDAAKADPTPKTFAALAREHSADKATYLRGGDLGFLTADGVSREPGLVVDAALVRAAARVRDGEFVSGPVAEGDRFSVVWRRGTLPATHRSLSDAGVADSIRRTILDERAKSETDALIARLRAAKVRDVDATPLDSLDWTATPARVDAGD